MFNMKKYKQYIPKYTDLDVDDHDFHIGSSDQDLRKFIAYKLSRGRKFVVGTSLSADLEEIIKYTKKEGKVSYVPTH